MSRQRVCNCGQQCLHSLCQSSDSGKTVRRCWCPDCRELRAEIKASTYQIIEHTVGQR